MVSNLPAETMDCIVRHLDAMSDRATILKLASLSSPWHNRVQQHLYRNVVLSSSTAAGLLVRSLEKNPRLERLVQSLTLSRGTSMRSIPGKKKGSTVTVEDAIEPTHLSTLSTLLPSLSAFHLVAPSFPSLRRRQVNFALSLEYLTTLSLIGREDVLLHLVTVGQIIGPLHQLQKLALRWISVQAGSLVGLSPPEYRLKEFALADTAGLDETHYRWLLRSTSWAESLRRLSLCLPTSSSPQTLHGIRYVTLRVTHLSLHTTVPGWIESFVLHTPSLLSLKFSTSDVVDLERLLGNLEWPLKELMDCSRGGGGLRVESLLSVLGGGNLQYGRQIERVVLDESHVGRPGWQELEELGRTKGFTVEEGGGGGSENWIPERFKEMRRLEI